MTTQIVEIEAPPRAKIMVLSVPGSTSQQAIADFSDQVRGRLRELEKSGDWPLVIALYPGWDIRWLDAETPA